MTDTGTANDADARRTPRPTTAFVLGGGGVLGAGEVGMLRALLEAGIVPDLVVGTSVGALNGAFLAAAPTVETTLRLAQLWRELSETGGVFAGSVSERLGTALRSRTHLHRRGPLRELLQSSLPVARIEDLQVPFQCVAAAVERAAEHWFTSGPLVDAVLASAAVPGLLAPVRIGEEHYLDGGLVNSIPVSRAVELGATTRVGAAGRPGRPAAHRADPPVGGGAGRLRDRPPSPLRARHGHGAGGGERARAADG